MNILDLPFNKTIGLEKADNDTHIFMLGPDVKYSNHLGTIHASAQFALAEATSGELLLSTFAEYSNSVMPIVRRVEVKYSKPASGKLYSLARIDTESRNKVISDLDTKGRALVRIVVKLTDEHENVVMNSEFEWFIQKMDK